jgi:hypothetical protein
MPHYRPEASAGKESKEQCCRNFRLEDADSVIQDKLVVPLHTFTLTDTVHQTVHHCSMHAQSELGLSFET